MRQPKKRQAVRTDSIPAIADAFLDWTAKHRAEDTYEWYRYRLQRFVEKYPDLRTDELRPYHVDNWVDDYQLSVTSRRNYLRSVKRCLKWAKKQGYIDDNPIADLEVPSAEHKEVVISQEEFGRLMQYCRNEQFSDLMEVTWETGCRPQESMAVEARHVDLENQRWIFFSSEAKGKKITRVVYLSDKALAITQRLMLKIPSGPIFRNTTGAVWTTGAVNCSMLSVQRRIGKEEMARREETISNKVIAKLIKQLKPTRTSKGQVVNKTVAELRKEAKRKLTYKRAAELAFKCSLYALRHSWATNALQKGIDPLTVAILMGHKDPSTLSKVYQHLSLDPQHMLQQARRAAG